METLLKNIIGIFISLLLFTACADEDEVVTSGNDGVITLKLENKKLSRATEPGNETENKLSWIDVFVYQENSADEPYLAHTRFEEPSIKGSAVTVKVPKKPVLIYVIANTPDGFNYEGKSLTELKGTPISADFTQVQTSFVMNGEIKVAADEAEATVELARVASKITLAANVKEIIDASTTSTTWTVDPEGVEVTFYNGVTNSLVGTESSTKNYAEKLTKKLASSSDLYTHTPFYSYSNSWDSKDANESYLLLMIKWKKNGGTATPYYYRVPVNKEGRKLECNHWYHIELNVSILGSEDYNDPVELDAKCVVLDWGKVGIDAGLDTPKYLVVDEQNVTMNNVETYTVKYASSSDVFFKIKKVWRDNPPRSSAYPDLFNEEVGEGELDITEEVKDDITFEVQEGKTTFTIEHKFMNDEKSTNLRNHFFRPWHIQVEVYSVHFPVGEGEIVNITQYPATYIVAENNIGGKENRFINGQNANKGTNTFDGLYDLDDHSQTNNWNKNQYIIRTTVLDKSSVKVVGDPRDLVDFKRFADFVTDGSKMLEFYYPAKTSGSDNIIAPAFVVASSWGQSGQFSYETAQKRCAAYQENGYPAGRWRIPTEAEIAYIASMSQYYDKGNNKLLKDGFIPMLFNGNYWASSKKYYNSVQREFKSDAAENHVRCVYDIWYWGEQKVTGFAWGDKRI